jgi:hypothetical protein
MIALSAVYLNILLPYLQISVNVPKLCLFVLITLISGLALFGTKTLSMSYDASLKI